MHALRKLIRGCPAYRQHGLPVRAAKEQEWTNGAATLDEAIHGAGRFASGKERHGAFDDI